MSGVLSVSVKCDEPGCNWTLFLDVGQVEYWHNKPCPQCHAGIIVNDGDLAAIQTMEAILELDKQLDPEGMSTDRVTVRLDTAGLRKPKH